MQSGSRRPQQGPRLRHDGSRQQVNLRHGTLPSASSSRSCRQCRMEQNGSACAAAPSNGSQLVDWVLLHGGLKQLAGSCQNFSLWPSVLASFLPVPGAAGDRARTGAAAACRGTCRRTGEGSGRGATPPPARKGGPSPPPPAGGPRDIAGPRASVTTLQYARWTVDYLGAGTPKGSPSSGPDQPACRHSSDPARVNLSSDIWKRP